MVFSRNCCWVSCAGFGIAREAEHTSAGNIDQEVSYQTVKVDSLEPRITAGSHATLDVLF